MNPENDSAVLEAWEGKEKVAITVLPPMSLFDLATEVTELGRGGKLVVVHLPDPDAPLSNFTSQR